MFLLLAIRNDALMMKGSVEVVKGRAYVYRNGRVLQAADDMTIYTGDVIETSRHGSVLLQMMDVGILKLKPLTQIKFPEEDTSQIQVSQVKLLFGEVWSKIKKMKVGESFEVLTPNAVSLVSNAISVSAFDKRRSKSTFSIIEGDVEIHKDQNHYFIAAGEKIIMDSRKNSKARHRKIDIYRLNQEWKKIITIREKLGRKFRESLRSEDADSKNQDYEVPLVHIVDPVEGVPINNRRVLIKATIFEEHLERVILSVNKKVVHDVNSSLKSFTREVLLSPGENVVELKAIDKFGNVGVDEKVFKLNDMPPAVSIFFPFDNLELNSRFVSLQGVVDDPDVREVEVYLNNRMIAKDRAVPTFRIPIILDVGENVIRVQATNKVGLTGKTEITAYTSKQANIVIQFNQFLN